ncbi:hypothetical protein BBAD15_g4889 [Beauveria bassiana D1-5]|uniref:Uncharacterized protein n=1 Tax=Beauveria bassiana D1-5 TaxID=1245745 RepID=A0A0A2VPG6_BEABA|nr:hypothetical protein BBAD15_g4889 [Beauveria bassiana D1-5]
MAVKPSSLRSKLTTLANITDVKDALLGDAAAAQRRPQQPGRLEHVLHGQRPRAPVDAHGLLAARVLEDFDRVKRVGVHGGKGGAREVGANGDEAEVKGPAQVPNLAKLRAARQRGVLGAVVVGAGGQAPRDAAVARVAAEPDGAAARGHGPRAPQRRVLVEERARRGVLAGKAGDAGGDCIRAGIMMIISSSVTAVDAAAAAAAARADFIHRQLRVVPPVQLSDLKQAAAAKPRLEAEPDEELGLGLVLLNLEHRRVREVVVVGVADDDGVDDGQVAEVAGLGRTGSNSTRRPEGNST